MPVIAIDFDGTIVSGDKALPGAKDAINRLRERGHKIIVHSCNNTKWIKKVLDNADIRYDAIWGETGLEAQKPVADLYVDDKGYHFQGDWPIDVRAVLTRLEGLDNRKAIFHEAASARASWNCPSCGKWVKEPMAKVCSQCRKEDDGDPKLT